MSRTMLVVEGVPDGDAVRVSLTVPRAALAGTTISVPDFAPDRTTGTFWRHVIDESETREAFYATLKEDQ